MGNGHLRQLGSIDDAMEAIYQGFRDSLDLAGVTDRGALDPLGLGSVVVLKVLCI